MDSDSSRKIISGSGYKTDACFTLDGQFIVYRSDFELELANIYKISIAVGNSVRLTNYTRYEEAPSVSSDDRTKLVLESCSGDTDDSQEIKLIILNL